MDCSCLKRVLLSTALALACAGSVHAAMVVVPTVPGSLDGANGVGGPGMPGGDATATAVTTGPSNMATATAGAGGTGDVGFDGGAGGTATATATTTQPNSSGNGRGNRNRPGRPPRKRPLQQQQDGNAGNGGDSAATANVIGVRQATVSATAVGGDGGGSLDYSNNPTGATAGPPRRAPWARRPVRSRSRRSRSAARAAPPKSTLKKTTRAVPAGPPFWRGAAADRPSPDIRPPAAQSRCQDRRWAATGALVLVAPAEMARP